MTTETTETIKDSNINASDWLKNWLKGNKVHRTISYGATLACPVTMECIDVAQVSRILYCPLCRTKLGNSSDEPNGNNIWEH